MTGHDLQGGAPFAVAGQLALGERLVDGAVVVVDGRIAEVRRGPREGNLPATILPAGIVAPGLIDLQVNGGFGFEVGRDPSAIVELAARLPATGVTAFLPTLISSAADVYPRVFDSFASAQGAKGARPLGLHLEGPFIAVARKGAHPSAAIKAADDALFACFAAEPAVRLVTLAPEVTGGISRVRRLRERDVLVSLGHTDGTSDEIFAAIDAGAGMLTHLFNAMSPFTHRAPGAVGAALADNRVAVGVIADGVHVHPLALAVAVAAKGASGIVLVSDMMAAAGMPAGRYQLGPQPVDVDTISARLLDGTLAGSILTLDQAVRNVAAWLDVSPAIPLQMATETPARLLALSDRGRLLPGYAADLVLLNDQLQVTSTIIGGEVVYRRPPE